MHDRTTLGFAADAAETCALTQADPNATERIFAACDWEHERKSAGGRIASALRGLPLKQRRFAQAVLKGGTRFDLRLSKSQFNRELKNILDSLNP